MISGTYELRSLETGDTTVVELGGFAAGRLARERIVAFIATYWARYGWAPTQREVAETVGLTAASAITHHIGVLVEAGRLQHIPGSPRSLRVVER